MDSTLKTCKEWDTVYTADCVEFCPIKDFFHLFIVGTYQLKETGESSTRLGKLYMLTLDDEIKILQEIEMPGILDARWSPHSIHGKVLLAIANAKGDLLIYELNQEDVQLSLIHTIPITSNLCLYVDWSNLLNFNSGDLIAVSDSDGKLTTCSLSSDSEISIHHKIDGHEYEAWVVSFNYWQPSLLYSGGDDCKLRGFDLRNSSCSPIFTCKEHDAGVTSINQVVFKENLLLTGSYDENMRIWDSRSMLKPLTTLKLDGGVWRLRSNPSNNSLILASCMLNGFKIIDIDNVVQPKIVANYNYHKSLAYGADWSRQYEENDYLIASVSFYDHLLCLWKYGDTRDKSKTE